MGKIRLRAQKLLGKKQRRNQLHVKNHSIVYREENLR
jgi:hypothetical protein